MSRIFCFIRKYHIIYCTSSLLAFLMTVVVGGFCLVLHCLVDDNRSQNITNFLFKAVFVCDEIFSFRIRWETIRLTLALIFGFTKVRKSRLTIDEWHGGWVTVQQLTDTFKVDIYVSFFCQSIIGEPVD